MAGLRGVYWCPSGCGKSVWAVFKRDERGLVVYVCHRKCGFVVSGKACLFAALREAGLKW